MNFITRLLGLMMLGSAVSPASTFAQLVHLSFTEPDNFIYFRADDVSVPWDLTGGEMTRLDIFYDVDQQNGDPEGRDPSRNFWRAEVQAHLIGPFEIIRPIKFIEVMEATAGSSAFELRHFQTEGGFEEFQFTLLFTSADPTAVPVPPFALGRAAFNIRGGISLFDEPRMGEGYGGGIFQVGTASIVPYPGFNPVPESSAFAWGSLALLALAIAQAKRRRMTLGKLEQRMA
jgi:hypothetical protein